MFFLYKIVNSKIDSMDLLSLVMVTVPQRPLRLTRTFTVPFSHTNSSVNSPLSRMSRLANVVGNNLDLFHMSLNCIKNRLKYVLLNDNDHIP